MPSPRTSLNRLLLLAVLVMLAFAFGACKRPQQTVSTTSSQTTDRQAGVTPRDTVITVPGASVSGSLPLPLPGVVVPRETVRSERAWSSVAVDNGRIWHSGGCDTTEFKATLYDRWEREHKASSMQQETTRTVEVRIIPKWVWWALAFGCAGLLRLLWPIIRRLIII